MSIQFVFAVSIAHNPLSFHQLSGSMAVAAKKVATAAAADSAAPRAVHLRLPPCSFLYLLALLCRGRGGSGGAASMPLVLLALTCGSGSGGALLLLPPRKYPVPSSPVLYS